MQKPDSKIKYFAGIDPGVTGAIAVILESGTIACIHDCPKIRAKKKYIVDTARLIEIVREVRSRYRSLHIVIEKPIAMPNNGRTMGSVSMLSFGYSAGLWEGAVASFKISYESVHPARWKRSLEVHGNKEGSVKMAKKIFGASARKYITLKKHHGRCDALLLAEYGRKSALEKVKNA